MHYVDMFTRISHSLAYMFRPIMATIKALHIRIPGFYRLSIYIIFYRLSIYIIFYRLSIYVIFYRLSIYIIFYRLSIYIIFYRLSIYIIFYRLSIYIIFYRLSIYITFKVFLCNPVFGFKMYIYYGICIDVKS
jgi:hypothetical protein